MSWRSGRGSVRGRWSGPPGAADVRLGPAGAGRGLRRPDKARGRSCEPGLGAEFAGLGAFRKAFRRPCMGMEAGYKQDIAELLPERGK